MVLSVGPVKDVLRACPNYVVFFTCFCCWRKICPILCFIFVWEIAAWNREQCILPLAIYLHGWWSTFHINIIIIKLRIYSGFMQNSRKVTDIKCVNLHLILQSNCLQIAIIPPGCKQKTQLIVNTFTVNHFRWFRKL